MSMLGQVRKWLTKPWETGDSPMEIRKAVLDDIESKVIAVGQGKKIFPFQHLKLHLRAETSERQAILESAIAEGWQLEESIRSALAVHTGRDLTALILEYELHEEDDGRFGERRFFIEYSKVKDEDQETGRPILRLEVVAGHAQQTVYEVTSLRAHIGRLPEVIDSYGRLERRNEIAFADEGEINATVSRQHASIRFDTENRTYWLRDDHSATGTRIFRDGRPVRIGSARRGVQLQDGDEISLGRAQLKVKILRSRREAPVEEMTTQSPLPADHLPPKPAEPIPPPPTDSDVKDAENDVDKTSPGLPKS